MATSPASENLRGMALMTAAMACFALADAVIKLLSATHSTGQIVFWTGIGGMVMFAAGTIAARQPLVTRDITAPPVLARIVAEALGTFGIVTALALVPLAAVVSIMQSVPLIVTLGAALLLAEKVGPRRWSAIAVGFAGVLLILRPGTEGFSAASLFAVLAAICLAMRDITTRMVPPTATNLQLGTWGFVGLIPTGALMLVFDAGPQGSYDVVALAQYIAISALTALAILLVTMSMRLGDVAVISPFRYTRLLFGLVIAMIWFAERPDAATWAGAAIIAGSGLYSFHRERRAALRPPDPDGSGPPEAGKAP